MQGAAPAQVLAPVAGVAAGPASGAAIAAAAGLIEAAERPVLLLGMLASQPAVAAVADPRRCLPKTRLAVASTYQSAGVLPRERLDCFGGRVGLFHNQPADRLLDGADLVVAIGYDPVEYDPALWNRGRHRKLVHVDCVPADIDRDYRPDIELLGDIAATLQALAGLLSGCAAPRQAAILTEIQQERASHRADAARHQGRRSIRCASCMAAAGAHRRGCDAVLGHGVVPHLDGAPPDRAPAASNSDQQRPADAGRGTRSPWAIAASSPAYPGGKVISVSGDGGFLFSAVELETAVRLKCNFVHLVWIDGYYDMVRFQQIAEFGRDSAVQFGPVDVVKFAEIDGRAAGLRIDTPDQIGPVLRAAMDMEGPVVIGIPVDYRDNPGLMAALHEDVLH